MKTVKTNIEQQIRKQIEGREITPSRDLWSEIESQSAAGMPKNSSNRILIAACLILTLSLGIVLFFNQENKPAATSERIVQAMTRPAVQSPEEPIAQDRPAESIAESRGQNKETNHIPERMEGKVQERETQAFTKQEELPAIRQNPVQIIPELDPISPEKTMAQSDSANIKVKKKRYVDPSTLLFSVEHKDVIEKTKGKSNVATIDLNGN